MRSVRDALDLLAARGATLVPVSVPSHQASLAPYQILSAVGSRLLRDSRFIGAGSPGCYPRHLIDGLDSAVRARGDELPPLLKLRFLTAEAMFDRFGSGLYAKACNARSWFAARYDAVLDEVDALAMATVVMTAPAYEPPSGHQDGIRRTLGMFQFRGGNPVSNTAPFNYTGHPAITVPCGLAEGLPVGLQFATRRWDDSMAVTLAHGYQTAAPPFPRP